MNAVPGKCVSSVKWLLEHSSFPHPVAWKALVLQAARNGQNETLELFRTSSVSEFCQKNRKRGLDEYDWWSCSCVLSEAASSNGHVSTLKWLFKNYPPDSLHYTIVVAARGGHLNVLQWLRDTARAPSLYGASGVESRDYSETVQRLAACFRDANELAVAKEEAVKNGYLEVVKWFHRNCVTYGTTYSVKLSIIYGHLRTTSWLYPRTPSATVKESDLFQGLPPTFEMLLFLYAHYPTLFTFTLIKRAQKLLKPQSEMSENHHVLCWLENKVQEIM